MPVRRYPLALAAALALALPLPADAQGILGRVKSKAAEVTGKKAGEKAADKAGVASDSRAPKFSDNLLEITPERLDQVLRGAAAEAEPARRDAREEAATRQDYEAKKRQYESDVQTYEQRKRDWQAKKAALDAKNAKYNEQMTAYQQCMQSTPGYQQSQAQGQAMAQRFASMSEAERAEAQKKLEDLSKRMQAAQARGDQKMMALLADSANMIMGMPKPTAQSTANAREMQKCGKMPELDVQAYQAEYQKLGEEPSTPQAPVEPPRDEAAVAARMARRDSMASRAAGLTIKQYGLMKERVAAYLAYGESPQKLGQYVFTPTELEALRAKKDRLTSYSVVFNNDALGWVYWNQTAENSAGGGRKRGR